MHDTIATASELHQAVAAAHSELASATHLQVLPWRRDLILHCHDAAEVDTWRAWWDRHDAAGWDAHTKLGGASGVSSIAYHHLVGHWRGWTVELQWLTRITDRGSELSATQPQPLAVTP